MSIIAGRIQQAQCQIAGLQIWLSDAYGKMVGGLSTDWLVWPALAFVDTQGDWLCHQNFLDGRGRALGLRALQKTCDVLRKP